MPRISRLTTAATWTRPALLASLLCALGLSACGRALTTQPRAATSRTTTSSDAAVAIAEEGVETQFVVTLADGVDPGEFAASHAAVLVGDAAGNVITLVPGSGQSPQALADQLGTDARALTTEPNAWLETAESRQQSFAFDDGAGSAHGVEAQDAVRAIGLAKAHRAAFGFGVTVAILDTGIDPAHPMLHDAYAGGIDLVDRDDDPSEQRDFVDNDGDGRVDEAFGHGTHVAGIVHLVAPGARLLAVRVLDDDGRGSLVDVVAGVRWAVAHGAKVINLSLGTLAKSEALQRALDEAQARRVIAIVSAGNWGDDKPVEFPASSPYVAAIGAVDAGSRRASFTSFGGMVALAAPGVAVRSAYPGGEYRLWSGTSMSAPFVAGTCALLAEVHPSWTLADMLARLASTAGRIRDKNGADLGAGALDAGAALAPDVREVPEEVPVPELARPR